MGFINSKKYVCVPYMRITAKFFIKEDFKLNEFQIFIIDSLNKDATLEQMVVATQLTINVIEAELIQLETQGLVKKMGNVFVLTDLSKKILFAFRKIDEMNTEKKEMCINLFTGDIDSYDENLFTSPCNGDIVLKHRNLNLDGISIEDNMDFFSEKLESLKNCDEQQKENVLSSMYVELYQYKDKNSKGILLYRRLLSKYIPCFAGDIMINENVRDRNITVEGNIQRVSFSFSFAEKEKYQEILPDLEKIKEKYPNMLSSNAHDVLNLYSMCKNYKEKGMELIYDGIADKIIDNKSNRLQLKNIRAQMVLDDVYVRNEELDQRFIEWIKEKECIDDSIKITIDMIKTEKYTMKICLDSLWGENDCYKKNMQ